MSKTLTLLAALLVLVAGFLMLRNQASIPVPTLPQPVITNIPPEVPTAPANKSIPASSTINSPVIAPANPSVSPAGTTNASGTPATMIKDPDFYQWREFSYPAGHFKVLLPGMPQHVSDTVEDPTTKEARKYDTVATATNNGNALMISVISFETPGQAKETEESLKAAVIDMLARNKANKVKTMKMGTFHGKPALDFSMNSGELLIEGKVVAHNDAIYILSMLNQKEPFNTKEYDFFINSFNFVDGGKELPKTN